MTVSHQLARFFVTAAVFAIGASPPAVAQDRDTQEVNRYVLTEAGLSKFTQATQKLSALPGACDEQDDNSNSQTIDQMVAKANATPGAQAAIQSAGMTTREYVVFMMSAIQTGLGAWALDQPGGKLPPGVSQANVNFYKQHEAAIAALGKNDPCGGDSGDEDEPEEESEAEPDE